MKPINHSKNKTEKCEKKTQYKKKGKIVDAPRKWKKKGEAGRVGGVGIM